LLTRSKYFLWATSWAKWPEAMSAASRRPGQSRPRRPTGECRRGTTTTLTMEVDVDFSLMMGERLSEGMFLLLFHFWPVLPFHTEMFFYPGLTEGPTLIITKGPEEELKFNGCNPNLFPFLHPWCLSPKMESRGKGSLRCSSSPFGSRAEWRAGPEEKASERKVRDICWLPSGLHRQLRLAPSPRRFETGSFSFFSLCSARPRRQVQDKDRYEQGQQGLPSVVSAS